MELKSIVRIQVEMHGPKAKESEVISLRHF